MRVTIFVFIALCVEGGWGVAYFDSITGLNLLGSHFGVQFFNASFDYVVIGGGTAGLTLATRLAQNASNSVAVIEAGGFSETDNGNLTAIPSNAGYWIGKDPKERNPLIDWEIYTEPMAGFDGRQTLYTQGKTLGGSSSRNSMAFHRPTTASFQTWADAVGDQSYTFEKLLPYFEKSVQFQSPNNAIRAANSTPLYNISSFSTTGGPLKVSFPNYANAYSSWAKLALKELGLEERDGFMDGSLLGYQYMTQSLDGETQTRSSSETSFLRTALRSTTNINIYKSTLAKRILFDSNRKAMGVLVNTAGVEYVLKATKEVILSAGAFRSPQLLMVSGVGPTSQLSPLGIPVISHRPGVGQNMWDQILFGPSYPLNVATHSRLQDPSYNGAQIADYIANGSGMLTNSASDFLGWEKLPADLRANLKNATLEGLACFPADWPELELTFPDGYAGHLTDFLTDSPLDGKNYGSIVVVLLTPFSRGNVTINSTDTAVNPVINPNFLTDLRDQDLAIQAFKRTRQIFQTKALQTIVTGPEAFPGPNVTTDVQILQILMQSSNTIYHASATNAMGKPDDPNAVVDPSARVIGVSGLRVVDASIFPFLPPGHPQSLVYALAEKIADLIQRGN